MEQMETARVLLGALLLATTLRPAAAAVPAGINLAMPAGAPTLDEIEAAAIAPVPSWSSPGAGLAPVFDGNGNPVVLWSDDGAYGGAFTDAAGNTIVSYQLSERPSQVNVITETLAGYDPGSIPAFKDAVTFAQQIVALTIAHGRSASRIYVTGFSEGGLLASYVGWRTGLPGVSFASCGIPGYAASGTPAGNFISFLEASDPIGQYGTDTYERASAVVASAHMDHYGTILPLETTSGDMQVFAAGIAGHTVVQYQTGTTGLPPDQINMLAALEGTLQSDYHQWPLYFADATALANAYGY